MSGKAGGFVIVDSHHADSTGVFLIEDSHHADNTVMQSEMEWAFSILTLQHRTVVYSVLTLLYCKVYLFSTVLFVCFKTLRFTQCWVRM